ncbi:Kelch-type beta propeller [Trema orientale]|uniref:Kelch-type beta propeller n=1 Tax=Trema orientale TaxID=63057 RepID=A0A2P5EHX1_TREOI|nr:Kelch-type beta propeller [Trema orientale]
MILEFLVLILGFVIFWFWVGDIVLLFLCFGPKQVAGRGFKTPGVRNRFHGIKALLTGGKNEPWSEKITVRAFDTETECWSLMEAKGDIPVDHCGHSVVRASSVLILFGGEDAKSRSGTLVFDILKV